MLEWGCRNPNMHEKLNAYEKKLVMSCLLIFLCKYESIVSFAIIKLTFIFKLSWNWWMSHLSRYNTWNDYIFDFLFCNISACVLEFVSEWKAKNFGKSWKETKIAMWVCCSPHTLKGEVTCECRGEKHKSSQIGPNLGMEEKRYNDTDQWMLCWDIHAKPTKLPQFWYTQKIFIEQWVLFQKMGIDEHWGEKFMWDPQNCPILVFGNKCLRIWIYEC